MRNILYRVRNSLSPASISSSAIGAGMALAGSFIQLGWHVSRQLAQTLTYVGVGLIILGILLATLKNFKNPIEKTNRLYSIISTLSSMEKRLLQLAGKQRWENIDWQKYRETNCKINQLMGVTVPKVASVDEAKKKIAGLEGKLEKKIFIKDQPLSKRVKVIQTISRLLDSDGFGLRRQRDSDKSYLRLNKVVDKYYDDYKDIMDRDLDILIKSHKDLAEAGANAFLVKRRNLYAMELADKLADIPNLLPPSKQADIEGLEDDIKDELRDIRIKISQHIREIESQKILSKDNETTKS